MKGVKTIRAVERTFDVLNALRDLKDASIGELEAKTGLPRPTLLRILKTLIEQGAVRRGLKDHRFRNCLVLGNLTEQLMPLDRLAEISAPLLTQLCTAVRWPSALGIYGDSTSGEYMQVVESTVEMTPFYIRRVNRNRVNLLLSSLGSAFLAHIDPANLDRILDRVHQSQDHYNLWGLAAGDLRERLAKIRETGYALRHSRYLGGTYNGPESNDELNSIAVPLMASGKCFGAVNISWNRQAMTDQEMIATYLPLLQKTAHDIAEKAEEQGIAAVLCPREYP